MGVPHLPPSSCWCPHAGDLNFSQPRQSWRLPNPLPWAADPSSSSASCSSVMEQFFPGFPADFLIFSSISVPWEFGGNRSNDAQHQCGHLGPVRRA